MNTRPTDPGSAPPEARSEFERRTQAVLEESTTRLDGRVRSRLNLARHAALEAHAARARSPLARWFGQRRLLAPAGAVAAVAVLAVVLFTARPDARAPLGAMSGPMNGDTPAALEDLELLADNDALGIASEGDVEFYEWALAEDGAPAAEGPVGT